MHYLYDAYYDNDNLITGDVVEVGLGWGFIAKGLSSKPEVVSLTSYEKDPVIVSNYTITHPNKHTVINQDILQAPITRQFDAAIIDVFDKGTAEYYDVGKQIVTKILSHIRNNGRIFIEYQSDVSVERDFRQWMKNQFGKFNTKLIHTGHRDSSRNIGYYIVNKNIGAPNNSASVTLPRSN